MPQFDTIPNQAIKRGREQRAAPVAASPISSDEPRMLSHWRRGAQAWRQVRKPLQAGIVSEWPLAQRAG
jgi:hypothetical protein